MPSLQAIRQFNDHLTSLGSEPEIVAGWGEDVEEIDAPEEGLDSDLSSLLADTGVSAEADEGDFAEPAETDEEPESLESLLEPEPDLDVESLDEADEALPDDLFADDDVTDEAPVEEASLDEASVDVPSVDEADFSDFEALLEGVGDEEETDTGDQEPEAGFADEADFDQPTAGFGDEALGEAPGDETVEPDFELPDFEADLGSFDEPAADEVSGDESFDEESFEDESFETPDLGDEFEPPDDGGFDESMDEGPGAPADEPIEDLDSGDFGDTGDFGGESFDLPDDEFTFDLEEGPSAPEADGAGDVGDEQGDAVPTFDAGGFEFSDEEFDAGEPSDVDDFSFGDEAEPPEGDEDLDEFSLGDFGAEFGFADEQGDESLNPADKVPEVSPGIPAAPTGFRISDGDFKRLQQNLSEMPLNLKIEVEKIVSEAIGSTEEVEQLVQMLVAGGSAQAIADFAGRIVGKTIRIPRGYTRRTGVDFEEERQSFAYQFRVNILPVLRLMGMIAVALLLLALAGYHLVFRPLYARSIYREGLELIAEDQYTLGNQAFERAREVWRSSRWFYSYAEAFQQERQYALASEKYEQLLFGMSEAARERANELLNQTQYLTIVDNRDIEKQGVLDYARLESEVLGNYSRADRLLQLILVQDVGDFEGRLAVGDNYMLWADEDPSRYEDARIAYVRLMERYGQTDQLLFRMLTYFIRTDNVEEVVVLKDLFQSDTRAAIESERYAELGGYLLDKGLVSDVEDVLFRALDLDPDLGEIHYNLARYYREIDATGEEDLALDTSRYLLQEETPLTRRQRGMLIDTHIRIGEKAYGRGNYLDAEDAYEDAINLYEESLRRRLIEPAATYGRAYARLGDVYYYVGREYETALSYFNAAEENLFDEPDLDYKQGYVHYRTGQIDQALSEFLEVEEDPSGLTNALLWATANTQYLRDNFFAAEAYYRELLDRVERQRDAIRTLLVDENPAHRSVIEYQIRGYNNLGVAMNHLHEETGDPDKYSEGLVYLTESAELAENYRRDRQTMVRSETVNLAFLNTREVLYPRAEYELQIYNDIPEDLDDLEF